MPIQILSASEPRKIGPLVVTLYGPPGVGKSTLGGTTRTPLSLDTDQGSARAGVRTDIVDVKSWGDIASISKDDVAGYDTLIVDTVGKAIDMLLEDMMQRDGKLQQPNGAPTIQAYGLLKRYFNDWIGRVHRFGLDLVLIAHAEEIRGKNDETTERLAISGGSKNLVYASTDMMGHVHIGNYRGAMQRVIVWDPTEATFGKNPGELPPVMPIPPTLDAPDFLAKAIEDTRARMQERSDKGHERHVKITSLRETLEAMDAAELTDWVTIAGPDASASEKALARKVAKAKGLKWDRDAKGFLPKAPKADAEAEGGGQSDDAAPESAEETGKATGKPKARKTAKEAA